MSRLTNEQPEDRKLQELLDNALSPAAQVVDSDSRAPSDLAQRIFDQSVDLLPKCKSQTLLDDAMPAKAPGKLASRIYHETVDKLPGRAVIARVGTWGLSWP